MQISSQWRVIPMMVCVLFVGACLMATCCGCRQDASQDGPDDGQGTGAAADDAPSSGSARQDLPRAKPSEPPPPPTIPKVRLTDALRATCLVHVGGQMPQGELPAATGQTHPLRELYGEKLTVVCFWTGGDSEYAKLAAVDMLEFIAKDIAEPFADQGVRVIGIYEGESPETANRHLATAEATFPNLLDADGAYFAQVASEKLPRNYLLDAEGKILWFDLEFSEITRQELRQAVEVALGEIRDK